MKTFSRILTVLGLALVIVTGALAFSVRNLPVTVLAEPKEAEQTAQALVDALNQGSLSQAAELLYGIPALEDHPDFEEPYLNTLWACYLESLTCRLEGGCYAADSGLYQDICVEALDISAALPEIKSQYEALLPIRSQAEETENVYNEEGGYRESFVLSVLDEAAREVLSRDCATTMRRVRLALVFREDQWWVLPQEGLMDILSGSLTGKEG